MKLAIARVMEDDEVTEELINSELIGRTDGNLQATIGVNEENERLQ